MKQYNYMKHPTVERSLSVHNWVHFIPEAKLYSYLELKLCYLKNLNLLSIRVTYLVLWKKGDEFFLFS